MREGKGKHCFLEFDVRVCVSFRILHARRFGYVGKKISLSKIGKFEMRVVEYVFSKDVFQTSFERCLATDPRHVAVL